MSQQTILPTTTGTESETFWVGYPSAEYLASMNDDLDFCEWMETQRGTEWFSEPLTADSVIQVQGPAHLCERAIEPIRFEGSQHE